MCDGRIILCQTKDSSEFKKKDLVKLNNQLMLLLDGMLTRIVVQLEKIRNTSAE